MSIEHLQALFAKLHIRTLVCVDDAYSKAIEAEDVVALVAALHPDLSECAPLFGALELDSIGDVEEVEYMVREFVQKRMPTSADRRLVYLRLRSMVRKRRGGHTAAEDGAFLDDLRSASALKDLALQIPNLSFVEVDPQEWKRDPMKHLGQLDEANRCLLLIDYDLKTHPETGMDLLMALDGLPNRKHMYRVLFSRDFSVETERKRAVELAVRYKWPAGSLMLLGKDRLHGTQDSFVRGIKTIALNSAAQHLLDSFAEVRRQAEEESHKVLSTWSPYAIFTTIVKSSESEGVWHVSTLQRILDVIRDDKIRELSELPAQKKVLDEAADLIKTMTVIGPELKDPTAPDDMWAIREKELFERASLVNELYTPLRLGDIFELTLPDGGQHGFILLAQPCDLMLRESRPSHSFLAPLVKGQASKPMLDGGTATQFDDYKRGERYFVDFKRTISVNALVLDLAVFNSQGQCSIDLNAPVTSTIMEDWKKRHEVILAELRGLQEQLLIVDQAGLPYALRSALLSRYSMDGAEPNFVGDTFSMPLRRSLHYRESRSGYLLSRYASYLGRPAFDHQLPVSVS